MNNLITKQVNLYGDDVIAIKDEKSEKIYAGINQICNALGLDSRIQRDKLKEHVTLSKGCTLWDIPSNGGIQKAYVIELDFLPLWLASINPLKVKDEVKEKLVKYQLKAKDVLAEAFIKPKTENSMKIVSMLHEEIGQLINVTTDVQSRVSKLEEEDYIKPFQKKALINARTSKVFEITGGKQSDAYKDKSFRSKVYQDIFRNIKNIYNVNEYDAIPKQKFSEALKLINEYQLPLQLKYELERINNQMKMSEEAVI